MPGQDDFEPLARQWRPAFSGYLDHTAADSIADEAIRVATAMLRSCGGCPILSQLSDALLQYWDAIQTNSLWNSPPHEADLVLKERLESLTRDVSDQRISTVAIRSANVTAFQLKQGKLAPHRSFELRLNLASQIIKDLIRHCFLDAARAQAVGGRFRSVAQSQEFYDNVMSHIDSATQKLAHRLVDNPTGKGLRKFRIVPKETTASMMFNTDFRLDA